MFIKIVSEVLCLVEISCPSKLDSSSLY